MAGGYLDNLISSFGGTSEGPDPTRLEGLLQLARTGLETHDPDLLDHVERMRGRIRAAESDRQNAFEGMRDRFVPAVTTLIQRNLEACRQIDASLGAFAEAYGTPQAAEHLSAYEQAAGEFLESSDRLAAMSRSSEPLCPRCGSSGPEATCQVCQLERLTPDPDFADEEFEQAEVNQDFQAVYQAYTAVIEGRDGLAQLTNALQGLEFTLLEAQALAEQSVEEHPHDPQRQELLQAVTSALEGVQRMHSVDQNRSTRELNQGWAQVFRGAATMSRLLPTIGLEEPPADE